MTIASPPAKTRILDAAFAEFSRRGFAGARVDEIAAQAGANKALLYHHYGDKEALFRAVLESKMAVLHDVDTSPARILDVIGDVFDLHAANPGIARLLAWEALDFGLEQVPNEAQRRDRLARHVEAIDNAQRAGVVDPSLDARHTLASLIGLVASWFVFPQMARMIAGGDPYSPAALAARRAHLIAVSRRILEAR